MPPPVTPVPVEPPHRVWLVADGPVPAAVWVTGDGRAECSCDEAGCWHLGAVAGAAA